MFKTASTLPAAAAAVVAAAAIAACGANSRDSSSPAGSGGHTYAQTMHDDINFVRCIRSHGVSIPNPISPFGLKRWLISSVSRLPVDQSAEMRCQHLLPGGSGPGQETGPSQARIVAGLAFARCMRARGFPSFPDPTSQGRLTPQMVTAAGIDLHQPKMLRTGLACVPVTHGQLTPA